MRFFGTGLVKNAEGRILRRDFVIYEFVKCTFWRILNKVLMSERLALA